MQSIEARVARLEAEAEIRRLQHEYGYRSSRGDWAAVAELFAPDGELEFGAHGRYLGRAAIIDYLASTFGGPYGTTELHAHLQVMPVITLSAGGGRARGTWRELGFGGGGGIGGTGGGAYWVEGPMDVDYVRAQGGWRIERLRWYRTLHVPFDEGWQETVDAPPEAGMPSSAPPSDATPRWPDLAETVPLHFRAELEWPAEPTGAATAPPADPRAFRERLWRLAEVHRIERMQAKQGYYFDKGFWAEVAALFAESGEIVLPGGARIIGRSAIIAWLGGFGPPGPQHGRLLDTVLVQPIVRLAGDGVRATGQWRGFLQWAEWGVSHEVGLVDLEVEYRLEHGQWRVGRLHVTRAVFTSYDEGWDRDLRDASRLRASRVGAVDAAGAGDEGPGPAGGDVAPADVGAGQASRRRPSSGETLTWRISSTGWSRCGTLSGRSSSTGTASRCSTGSCSQACSPRTAASKSPGAACTRAGRRSAGALSCTAAPRRGASSTTTCSSSRSSTSMRAVTRRRSALAHSR